MTHSFPNCQNRPPWSSSSERSSRVPFASCAGESPQVGDHRGRRGRPCPGRDVSRRVRRALAESALSARASHRRTSSCGEPATKSASRDTMERRHWQRLSGENSSLFYPTGRGPEKLVFSKCLINVCMTRIYTCNKSLIPGSSN